MLCLSVGRSGFVGPVRRPPSVARFYLCCTMRESIVQRCPCNNGDGTRCVSALLHVVFIAGYIPRAYLLHVHATR